VLKLVTFSALALLLSDVPTADAAANKTTAKVATKCPGLVEGMYYYRRKTHHWEIKLNVTYTKSTFNASKIRSCAYTKWVAHRWMKRAHVMRVRYAKWLHNHRTRYLSNASPQAVICSVFGPYCSQAIAVANCEGGFSPYAQNGQYLGTFQMGAHERAIYGHGYTIYEQAKAAYAYFVDSGSNWSPWSCKPY